MVKQVRYTVNELLGIGFTLVVLGIALAYGLDITKDVQADFCEYNVQGGECRQCDHPEYSNYNSTAENCYNTTNHGNTTGYNITSNHQFNASQDTMSGISNITSKVPTIATVVVAAVVIGILVVYLWQRFANA